MADLTDQLLPALLAHRLTGMDLGTDVVLPYYAGFSILNLPNTLSRWLGAPGFGAEPLGSEMLNPLGLDGGIRPSRVILVLMDALSHLRLRRWLSEGVAPVWGSLVESGVLAPITSIVPSTTSAALTTLWTGQAPVRHGNAGYELWLKEYGVIANMITHSAFSYHGDRGGLQRAGFEAEAFLPVAALGSHLASHGVGVYAYQEARIVESGLSKMNLRGVQVHGFFTPVDAWMSVRQLLESWPDKRLYVWVYWDAVDTLSHLYGPDDERTMAEFAHFSAAFQRHFVERLSPDARAETLVVLLADHGQITTRPDPHFDLKNHPNLTRRLHMLPTGENRMAYLFVRPGQTGAVQEYLERTWPHQFAVVDAVFAVDAGLFGPGEPHPRLYDRLGDMLVIARGDAYLWWGPKENPIIGRHGGLSRDEMLVPFLAGWL